MKPNAGNALKILTSLVNRFEAGEQMIKTQCLKLCTKVKLKPGKWLMHYHDVLLFLISHPQNAETLALAEKELERISRFLNTNKNNPLHLNSGLPFSEIETHFSHDIISWMLSKGKYELSISEFEEGGAAPGDVLKLCLPSAERELTSYGFDTTELFEALHLKPKQQLAFLVERLSVFNNSPLVKDYLFDLMQINLSVYSKHKTFSRTYNRFLKSPVFFHQEIMKRFNYNELLCSALPKPATLTLQENEELISVIKNSLILTARETDPATYLDLNSLRYYVLERGITIAIYTMENRRQLPFESYVGYTLFKNSFPAAYGGAWVFGKRALFGMNIFESFRGGESGYMMCQLLRVYRQVFDIACFEVEPYQFGKDNPDGIKSGAFWFYYRYGFKPVDSDLRKLAEKEHKKISAGKGYHSPYQTLEKFTDSFISLELEKTKQQKVSNYSEKITRCIASKYKGQRHVALSKCVEEFCAATGLSTTQNSDVLKEFALLAAALKINKPEQFNLLKELVLQKPVNLYRYQAVLREFLKGL